MPLGLFIVTVAVALLWSGLANKDLREAIPLILQNKDASKAKPISGPRPDTFSNVLGTGGGMSDTTISRNLGGQVTWTKARVYIYTLAIAKAFRVTAGHQCRDNNVRPAYGAKNSLHYRKNGCRARDFTGKHENLARLENWAKAQGKAFAEVLYTGVPGHGPGMGGTRHLHLGFPTNGPQPVIPGSQSSGGSGGGGF